MVFSVIVDQFLMLALTLHAALVGAAAGAPLWRALPVEADNFELRAFFALAIGFAVHIALVFTLGLFGLLNAGASLAALGAAGLLAAAWLRNADLRGFWRLGGSEFAVAAVFYVCVAAAAIKAPGYFDDTMYHLPLARFYADTHGLGLDSWVRFPLFPQNMEMLFALALALRPDDALLAEGFATLPAFVVVLGLVGAGRWLRGARLVGVAAAAIFLTLRALERTLGYAYIESGLALFCFAPALGVVLFRAQAPLGVHVLLGALAGTAAGCKLQGAVFSVLVFCALVVSRTRPRALLAFALAATLFGCGWYVRSFVISGDPVSPAGGPWFGYFLWDAGDLAGQKAELATHGVGTALWRFPQALIKGGAAWLLPGLLAPLAAMRHREVVLALWGLFVAYALFWFYVSQVDRYLAPVAAIGVLLTTAMVCDLLGLLIARVGSDRLRPTSEVSLVVMSAVLAVLVNDAIARADQEIRGWGRILAERPGYLVMRKADEAAPRHGDRLVSVGFENAQFFYHGVAMGDWFGPARYRQMLAEGRLVTAEQMRDFMNRFQARLLAVNLEAVKYDSADYSAQFDTLFIDGRQALYAIKSKN